MKAIEKVLSVTCKVIDFISRINVIVMFCVVFAITITRYFISYSPVWGEELATFVMAWMLMLSTVLAHRDGAIIRITVFERFFKRQRTKNVIGLIEDVIVVVCCCIVIPYAYRSTVSASKISFVGLPFSELWLYLSLLVVLVGIVACNVEKYLLKITKCEKLPSMLD